MALETIDRPPRIQLPLPVGEENVPSPPEIKRDASSVILNLMLPMITILGFAFTSGSGNLTQMLPMGLAMIASVGVSIINQAREKRELMAKRKLFSEKLREMRHEMTTLQNAQRLHHLHNHPDMGMLLDVAARKETSRFGGRLWERKPSDRDFGAVRLGIGARPSTYVYKFEATPDVTNEDLLLKDAKKLADDSATLRDAPIVIPLRSIGGTGDSSNSVRGKHVVGVFGRNAAQTGDFVRAMLANYAAFQAPHDTRMFIISHPGQRTNWQWAEWLPHVVERSVGDDASDNGRARPIDSMCFSNALPDTQKFWRQLKKELEQRQVRMADRGEEGGGGGDVSLPHLLVVADISGELPKESPLNEVAAEAVVALITKDGARLGASVIFVANDSTRIPTDCSALIEVAAVGERVGFRYTEVGVNAPALLGDADLLSANDARQNFAARIRRLEVQRPFGSDLPRAVDLLQLNSVLAGKRMDTVDSIPIGPSWQNSVVPAKQEWLSAPIGMTSGKDVRSLWFSAKEGGDGVHGMVAGTTGSGKSEMLLTLIAEMAMKYDPRIVNFVLVDYKGGSSLGPARRLPHVVDFLTNLQANAVERMFVALQAVMEERQRILERANAKDIVDYRTKVVPNLSADSPLPRVFPHLFIIVDEFAEMITANPDYKQKFESVTRLGRSFGVSLILATQRPAGVVTDQMRANMKFRMCLRVETPADSKELLGRGDAAFLPNIGGRGYLAVGNDVLQPIQVAWAGKPYDDTRTVTLKDVVWLDEEKMPTANPGDDAPLYSLMQVSEALALPEDKKPETVLDWIVGVTNIIEKQHGLEKQSKPWPDPLPEYVSLTRPISAQYLNSDHPVREDGSVIINQALGDWLANADDKYLWPEFSWKKPSGLRADLGIVDNPYAAEQRLLRLELGDGPIAIFGAAGRGKSAFLKSLLVSLAASRTPRDLNMYALDFGSDGLKEMRELPHMGAVIKPADVARVDQMVRMLRSFMNERQERLAKYTSLADYNAKNPDDILPEIVFVIDNFAEVRESFEALLPELISMARDGRAFGIHFVVTAGIPNDLSSKFLNCFAQRLSLAQPDYSAYADIVGSGAPRFDNVPGRGVMLVATKDRPLPLEFQFGQPGVLDDDLDDYTEIALRMLRAWEKSGGKRPAAELPRAITLLDMYSRMENKVVATITDLDLKGRWARSMKAENMEWLRAPIGLVSSKEIKQMIFQAQADGVHGMAAGTTGSGKSELLQTLIAAMAIKYDPRIVNFVLIDYKGGPTVEPFRKLPHCVDIGTNLEGNKVQRIFTAINAEMDRRSNILAKAGVSDLVEYRKKVAPGIIEETPERPKHFPHLFIIVDEFAEMMTQDPEYKAKFESITRLGRSFGVSLILATQRPGGVVSDQMRANMKFRLCLRVETPEDSKELLKRPDGARLPQIAGRGYAQAGTDQLTEFQAAWSGAPYTGDADTSPYPRDAVMDVLGNPTDAPRSVLGWLVGAMALEAKQQNIEPQFKPWPDNLPAHIPINRPIDASYLGDLKGSAINETVLAPGLANWVSSIETKGEMPEWPLWDWQNAMPLRATVGVADDAWGSMQRPVSFDLTEGPLAVFGASGRGKTTLLKTLMFGLAAERTPAELNLYCLDFGRGGLRAVRELPHCGASYEANQPDRVEALFRMMRGIMRDRQERMEKGKFASMHRYNEHVMIEHRARLAEATPGTMPMFPDTLFAAIVIAIDNFIEFRENFENLLPDLMSLIRDGRQFGINFVVSTPMPNDLPGKMGNLFGQTLTFTLPDPGLYNDLLGRGALAFPNIPGRGLVKIVGLESPPLEFHVAVPVIEGERDDPFMRIAEAMESVRAKRGYKKPSAEIPKAVTLLRMYEDVLGKPVSRIGDIPIRDNWARSMLPQNQEWLSAPIGYISSKELRNMLFSAKAGGDGVHGLAAGTTGSGKSELLQTLIAAMAIKYDPRIVNFVLVDFKGGPTVEPFRKLPHCVDIGTDLEGNKVERIFTAIGAEMKRRSNILAKAGVADLVEYRKKIIPTIKQPTDERPLTFPHLFIIVDEFAEMMTQNPEYKMKFESITRLGRSFGVSLLLATQRPAGVVSDQMRSNMKYRMCLRVETADDSKELLKRPDAATLPALGGRGYIQVGGGELTEIQVAWSGAPFDWAQPDPAYQREDVLKALDKENEPPLSVLGWLVGTLAAEARAQGTHQQFKPWPDPLLDVLPINTPVGATYIKGTTTDDIVLNPAVAAWMANSQDRALWKPHHWRSPLPFSATIGLVDNPYQSEQRLLTIDLRNDPLVIFGLAGRGKSMLLRSLICALAAQYSPIDLHIYILDLGRGGLKGLKALPHVGGVVEGREEERVERFFRMLRSMVEERQLKLQSYESLDDHNAKNPAAAIPSVLVVIDNIAEFKENHEKYMPDLIALLRDGRSFGINFVITANMYGDVTMKMLNLLTQRMTFTLSDPSDYTSIVGRGWMRFNDVPGRGLCLQTIGGEPQPLEFQAAVPLDAEIEAALLAGQSGDEAVGEAERLGLRRRAADDSIRMLVNRMQRAWAQEVKDEPEFAARAPMTVEPLPLALDLAAVQQIRDERGISVALGLNDTDRKPLRIDFSGKGPNLMVIGPPVSGKTSALRALTLALAQNYSPEQLAMVLLDPSDATRRFYGIGGEYSLDKLPHVLGTATNGKELEVIIQRLRAEFDEAVIAKLQDKPAVFKAQDNSKRAIIVIADHYDEVNELAKGSKLGITGLAETGKGKALHFVLGGSLGILRGGADDLRKRVENSRYSFVLQDVDTVRYLGVRNVQQGKELPAGRGFAVKALTANLAQLALPAVEGRNGQSADALVSDAVAAICRKHRTRAAWSYFGDETAELELAVKGDAPAAAEVDAGADGSPVFSADMADAENALEDARRKSEALMAALLGASALPTENVEMVVKTFETPDEPAAEPEPAPAKKKK